MAKVNAAAAARKRRRTTTLVWIAVVTALVTGLIYKEQVALIYILATVSVTALLVVVAMADLGESRQAAPVAPFDDAAAVADGTNATARARRR
jgi:hypothetical protein